MGVEYSWCKAKQYFKTINDKVTRNLGGNVEKALDVAVLSLDLVRRYARRARDMMEVYRMLQASGGTVATKAIPYAEIMKVKATRKSHRNIMVGWMPKVAAEASASG
jgi:hypothetical protein